MKIKFLLIKLFALSVIVWGAERISASVDAEFCTLNPMASKIKGSFYKQQAAALIQREADAVAERDEARAQAAAIAPLGADIRLYAECLSRAGEERVVADDSDGVITRKLAAQKDAFEAFFGRIKDAKVAQFRAFMDETFADVADVAAFLHDDVAVDTAGKPANRTKAAFTAYIESGINSLDMSNITKASPKHPAIMPVAMVRFDGDAMDTMFGFVRSLRTYVNTFVKQEINALAPKEGDETKMFFAPGLAITVPDSTVGEVYLGDLYCRFVTNR